MLELKKRNESNTMITVGPYRICIERERFLQWERTVMSKAGFTKADIHAEIVRRLGV